MAASIFDNVSTPDQFSTDLSNPALVTLDHLDCYEVSGDDASTFLQGQFSNDINDVSPTSGQLTSYCTPKGRMLAIMYICQFQENYLLLIPSDIAEEVIKRLQMFVMRSKVKIAKSSLSSVIGIYNDTSSLLLSTLDIDAPDQDYACTSNDSAICMKIPGSASRFLVVGDDFLESKLSTIELADVDFFMHDFWKWLDILAGIPSVNKYTQEAFVPQMANMELINGVSFSKGCYPGQEIVARLHYLGNANRRMFRIKCNDAKNINDGDDIYSAGNNQSIGKILSVIKHSNNTADALAVIRLEAVKENQLAAGSTTGSPLELKGLPYEVPIEENEKSD